MRNHRWIWIVGMAAPLIVLAQDRKQFTLKPGGSLRDISPTVLGMLGIPQPKEMTGHDLRTPAV